MRNTRSSGPAARAACGTLVAGIVFFTVPAPIAGLQLPGLPGATEQQADTAPASAAPQPEPLPGVFEVVPRYRAVADSATQAEREVARLASAAAVRAEVEEATRRQTELQALLASLVETEHVRAERLSRVRDQALLEDQRLEGLRGRTLERLEQLGALRAAWLERQRFWQRWRRFLRDDPESGVVAEEMAGALARIDSVLAATASAMTPLLTLQRQIEELRAGADQIGARVLAARQQRRQALLQRGEPVLLSAGHREQLRDTGLAGWQPLTLLRPAAYVAFVRDHTALFLLHLLLGIGIGLAARRLRRPALPEGGWSGTLEHPWALAILLSTSLALQRVVLAPPLWDVALWILLSGSAALLARRVLPTRALRLTVYLIGGLYPVLLLLESLQLPAPVLRLMVALLAAAALPVFVIAARRRTAAAAAEEDHDPRRIWPLRIGAALWAVVLVTVAVGYDALGRWVLHATITSAATVFVVVVLIVLLRGAVATLLRVESREHARFLRSIGVPLARRIMLLVQVVLIAATLLILLDVWEVTSSPLVTWSRIAAAGVDIAGVRVTLGRVLLGFAVIYLAVMVSWLLRTAVQSEVYRRWDFDRGVGDSINRLVHYTLITAGVLFALAVLGVRLQNFAIVMGALGIGIGFGLQNVVNNFVSGLILLFERPVRVGDTVVVDGEWGTIRKIGLRSTIMLTFDQSEMIVPNADLVSEKVTNWTLSNPVARVILPVGVAYGSDIERVLTILRESAAVHESVLVEPPPQALFVGFGDSSLDFELRVWVREIRLRLEVRSTVLTEVERRLTAAGIEIPFPQRDLHVRSIDRAAAEALLTRERSGHDD